MADMFEQKSNPRPKEKWMSFRASPELFAAIDEQARAERRSRSGWVTYHLERIVEQELRQPQTEQAA